MLSENLEGTWLLMGTEPPRGTRPPTAAALSLETDVNFDPVYSTTLHVSRCCQT